MSEDEDFATYLASLSDEEFLHELRREAERLRILAVHVADGTTAERLMRGADDLATSVDAALDSLRSDDDEP